MTPSQRPARVASMPTITVVQQGDDSLPPVDFTVGLPGCGKSTYARAQIEQDRTIVRVNNDDLGRAMSTGRTKENGSLLATVRATVLRIGIEQERRVIVDNTNLSPRAQREIFAAAARRSRTVRRIDFTHVTRQECILRDALRHGNEMVGAEVINRMAADFLPPEENVKR